MTGRVFTFYSWKGGVGRTMAVANVGIQLARRGKRVLLVDWDLEAPGLDRYFQNRHLHGTPATDATGLLGLLTEALAEPRAELRREAWQKRCAQYHLHPQQPPQSPPAESSSATSLHLLPSGLGSPDYGAHLQALSWTGFFSDGRGGQWLEDLRDQWRESYDAVLIDSRTGLTDSGGVCTVQMPDALVLVYTSNNQSLQDGLAFLSGVHKARAAFAFERAPLTMVPLLARWEGGLEADLADAWLLRIESAIRPLVEAWLPRDLPVRRVLERLRVPHVARFSFGEPLPVLTHSLTDPERPGLAYDLVSELIASGFANAGTIIDPSYRASLDPMRATDAEVAGLVANDSAREETLKQIRETVGAESLLGIGFMLRLAQGGLKAGRTSLADDLARTAAATARRRLAHAPDGVAELRALSAALDVQGEVRRRCGGVTDALLAHRESLALSRRLAEIKPADATFQRDIATSHRKVGGVLRDQGDFKSALGAYDAALAVTKRLIELNPGDLELQRDLSICHDCIGTVLRDQGDSAGALAAFRQSLTGSRGLAATDPTNLEWQRDISVGLDNIGDVMRDLGDLTGALASYHEALVVSRRLADADPDDTELRRDVSVGQNKIGDALRDQGDLDGALAAYRESLATDEQLAKTDPSNSQWQHDWSVSLERVGDVLRRMGDLSAALAAYRECLRLRERLTEADASNARWQRDFRLAQDRIGDVLRGQGDLPGALAAYREGLAVSRRLTEADPSNTEWQRDLSVGLAKLGDLLLEQGELAGPLRHFQESLGIRRHLAEVGPTNARWQRDLSYCLTRIAQIHWRQGDARRGLSLAEEGLAIDERLSALDPTNSTWQQDVSISRKLVEEIRSATM